MKTYQVKLHTVLFLRLRQVFISLLGALTQFTYSFCDAQSSRHFSSMANQWITWTKITIKFFWLQRSYYNFDARSAAADKRSGGEARAVSKIHVVTGWLCKVRPQSYLSLLVIIWGQTSIISANTKRTVPLLNSSSKANKQLLIPVFAKHFHPLITRRV